MCTSVPGLKTLVEKRPRGGAAPSVTAEDGVHLGGAADADVVGDKGLEKAASATWVVEHDRARDLDLAHRELVVVASGSVDFGEWHRDHRLPAPEEPLDVARGEPVTDRLQPRRVTTGGEAIRECGIGEVLPVGLALGPLMAVAPDLRGIREVGADLDEAGAELRVEDVEVVHPDAALLLHEVEAHQSRGARAILRAEHPRVLLSLHDGDDPAASLGLCPF
jgi:hypothetical protein